MLLVINSNGLIEQWGYFNPSNSTPTIPLNITFSKTSYFASCFTSGDYSGRTFSIQQRNTNNFQIEIAYVGTSSTTPFIWSVIGY